MKEISIIALCLLVFMGCKNKSAEVSIDDIINETTDRTELEVSEESINEIIQSIPSPLEIAAMIKASGAEFDQGITNSTSNRDKYLSGFEKALAMGIYAGDLGYINIYEKSHHSLSYLQAIKSLADDLSVGQFFDFETIKRLASNSNKLDSLLYLSTMNFERMDQYLRDQRRSNLSVLLVTGMWLESMYIASQVALNTNSLPMFERIGEQKMVLDQVILMVSAYEGTSFFEELNAELKRLKDSYADVTIDYIYREPETVEKDGRLVIIDKSETIVNISGEQVSEINEVLTAIRNKLTGNS